MCFHGKRFWLLVIEQSEHPWRVGAESTEFTVMPENGFSPRATSVTVVVKSGYSYIVELLKKP